MVEPNEAKHVLFCLCQILSFQKMLDWAYSPLLVTLFFLNRLLINYGRDESEKKNHLKKKR